MSDGAALPAPAAVVGRVGQVALLRRMRRAERNGRLVLVHRPLGWMRALSPDGRLAYGWEVVPLGEPFEIDGLPHRQVQVADGGLVPVGALDVAEAQALAQRLFRDDGDAAMADLARQAGLADRPPDEFARIFQRVQGEATLRRALTEMPTGQALRALGFRPDRFGGEGLQWSGVHDGTELQLSACPDLFDAWTVWARGRRARSIVAGETRLPSRAALGSVGQAVLRLWQDGLPGAPAPDVFAPGRVWANHRKLMSRLPAHGPRARVTHPPLLRAIVRLLREQARHLPADTPVAISCDGESLALSLGGERFGCQVAGDGFDPCVVALGDVAGLTAHALDRGALIERVDGGVLVNGRWAWRDRQDVGRQAA